MADTAKYIIWYIYMYRKTIDKNYVLWSTLANPPRCHHFWCFCFLLGMSELL